MWMLPTNRMELLEGRVRHLNLLAYWPSQMNNHHQACVRVWPVEQCGVEGNKRRSLHYKNWRPTMWLPGWALASCLITIIVAHCCPGYVVFSPSCSIALWPEGVRAFIDGRAQLSWFACLASLDSKQTLAVPNYHNQGPCTSWSQLSHQPISFVSELLW